MSTLNTDSSANTSHTGPAQPVPSLSSQNNRGVTVPQAPVQSLPHRMFGNLPLHPILRLPLDDIPSHSIVSELMNELGGSVVRIADFEIASVPAPFVSQQLIQHQNELFTAAMGIRRLDSIYYVTGTGRSWRVYNEIARGLRFRYCHRMKDHPHVCNDPRGCMAGYSEWISLNFVIPYTANWAPRRSPTTILAEHTLLAELAQQRAQGNNPIDLSRLKMRCINCSLNIANGRPFILYDCIHVQGLSRCYDCYIDQVDEVQQPCWPTLPIAVQPGGSLPVPPTTGAAQTPTGTAQLPAAGVPSQQSTIQGQQSNIQTLPGSATQQPNPGQAPPVTAQPQVPRLPSNQVDGFDTCHGLTWKQIVAQYPLYLEEGTLARVMEIDGINGQELVAEMFRALPAGHPAMQVRAGSTDPRKTLAAKFRRRLAETKAREEAREAEADRQALLRRCRRCKDLRIACSIREDSREDGPQSWQGDDCSQCSAAEAQCIVSATDQKFNNHLAALEDELEDEDMEQDDEE